eukprot:135676_1
MPGSTEHKGDKWYAENYDGSSAEPVVIKPDSIKESIYIGGSKGPAGGGAQVFKVEGKFKSLTINNCQNVGVVFGDVVAVCEVMNCKKVQVQTTGLTQNFQIDKSEGVTVFLSEKSIGAKILTAQTTGTNIMTPDGDEMKEHGLPEMFSSQYDPETKTMKHAVAEGL